MLPGYPEFKEALPASGSEIAALPKEDRRSLKDMEGFFYDQYQGGLHARRHHALAWIMVQSFLRGVHYFDIDPSGGWCPIPADPDRPRAICPVIGPRYQHILGFMSGNSVGVSTIPIGNSPMAVANSQLSKDSLDYWLMEANIPAQEDIQNQVLLTEGTAGLFRYIDPFRQTVGLRVIHGSELFPVPYDARHPSECDGFQIASIVSKAWLELQDELYERQTGQRPTERMGDAAIDLPQGMALDLPQVGAGLTGGNHKGALALFTYMKPTEQTPGGIYSCMIDRKIYRLAIGIDPKTGRFQTETIMPYGKVPLEISYYRKNPKDFWGTSLCETLLPSQLVSDREKTYFLRSTLNNRSITWYDNEQVKASAFTDDPNLNIPITRSSNMALTGQYREPMGVLPAKGVGRDDYALMDMERVSADEAAGMRSGIIYGQQEGRTESGPATSLLSQNAMASLQPMLKSIYQAWSNTLPCVLDMLKMAWPAEKTITVTGPNNVGRQRKILSSSLPASQTVIIKPQPFLAGGSSALLNILFQLKQLPGQDGLNGTFITREEFFRGIRDLGFLPPGIKLEDEAFTRIQARINGLIGDTIQPSIPPADLRNPGIFIMEDHRTAMDMLRKAILDPTFLTYGPNVQRALTQELEFHRMYSTGDSFGPNAFDDDLERQESQRMTGFLAAAEQDLSSTQGDFLV